MSFWYENLPNLVILGIVVIFVAGVAVGECNGKRIAYVRDIIENNKDSHQKGFPHAAFYVLTRLAVRYNVLVEREPKPACNGYLALAYSDNGELTSKGKDVAAMISGMLVGLIDKDTTSAVATAITQALCGVFPLYTREPEPEKGGVEK